MKSLLTQSPFISNRHMKFVYFLVKCQLFFSNKCRVLSLCLLVAVFFVPPQSEANPCRTIFDKALQLIKPQRIGLEVEVIGLSHQKALEKITKLYPDSQVESNRVEIKKIKHTEVETLIIPTQDAELRHIFNSYILIHNQNEGTYTLKGGHLSFNGKTINSCLLYTSPSPRDS